MASTKAGGTAKNLRDSKPKYLGVKVADGDTASPGMVLVRQRGTRIEAGRNVGIGKDHTLFALVKGTVNYRTKRKISYTGHVSKKTVADVL